jgi:hypothetical protein
MASQLPLRPIGPFIGTYYMKIKPSFYTRCQTLFREHTRLSLTEVGIISETDLLAEYPPTRYTPAQIVSHLMEVYGLGGT